MGAGPRRSNPTTEAVVQAQRQQALVCCLRPNSSCLAARVGAWGRAAAACSIPTSLHPCNFQAGSPDWTTAFGRSLLGPQSPIQNAARLRPPGLCDAAQTLGRKCATGRRGQPNGQAFVLSPPVVVRNNGARRRRPPTHDGGPASSRHLCRCFESNRPTTDPGSMGRSIGACGPRPRGRMGACAEGLRPRAQGVLSIHQVIGLEWQRDLIQMLCSRPSALTYTASALAALVRPS